MRNPYDYTSSVNLPEAYVGRASVRRRLESLLSVGESVRSFAASVVAPRRLGTTSTLKYIAEIARREGSQIIWLDMRDLPRPLTLSGFLQALAEALEFNKKIQWNEIRMAITHLFDTKDRPPLMIVIDEFDVAKGSAGPDIIRLLGALVNDCYNFSRGKILPLSVIIGSTCELISIEESSGEIYYSPYSFRFTTLHLSILSHEEAIELINKSAESACFHDQEISWLIEYAGRWPFYLKLACHHAFNYKMANSSQIITGSDRKLIEDDIYIEAQPYMKNLLQSLSKRDLSQISKAVGVDLPLQFEYATDEGYDAVRIGILQEIEQQNIFTCNLFRKFFSTSFSGYKKTERNYSVLPSRKRVFISYSREDIEWLRRVRIHLKSIEHAHAIDIWDDTQISAGSDWKSELDKAVYNARIIILLISANFLASNFIQQDQLPSLLEAEKKGAIIIPLIISPCMLSQHIQLSRLQSINSHSEPLTALSHGRQEEALARLSAYVLVQLTGD